MGCDNSCGFIGGSERGEPEIRANDMRRLDIEHKSKDNRNEPTNANAKELDPFKDYFYMDSVERYNVKYRPREAVLAGSKEKVQV